MHHFKESAVVPTPPKQPKKGGKKIIFAALVVMTGIACAAGAYAFKLRKEVATAPAQVPQTTSYYSLAPTAPAIRNRLVMLFGQQTIETLRLRAGKENLQKQALAETKAALAAEKASANVHSVIFTSLVTQ